MSIKNNENEDRDSSRETWKYYKDIYTENHWSLIKEFDLEKIRTYQERIISRLKKSKDIVLI